MSIEMKRFVSGEETSDTFTLNGQLQGNWLLGESGEVVCTRVRTGKTDRVFVGYYASTERPQDGLDATYTHIAVIEGDPDVFGFAISPEEHIVIHSS